MKVCTICDTAYPETRDYFYWQENGFRPYCKTCDNAKRRQRYRDNHEQELQRAKIYNGRFGKTIRKRWYSKNKDHIREYLRKRRATNRELYRNYDRKCRLNRKKREQ